MASTKTASELASLPPLQRLAELRSIDDIPARRALTAQARDLLLLEWKRDPRWRGSARHLIEDVHSWFRQGFEDLTKQAIAQRRVDMDSFQRLDKMLHHHHSLEDRMWFPRLQRLHPDSREEIDILERDHKKLVELEGNVSSGDCASLVEFCDHLIDHLNREEMLSVPWLLDGTGGF
ncbi:hypothetical protein LEN26_012521 [Aphanomyces euteiches]|nr:hypothetical protein AeMF1_021547 [Aphanomyces euteiches]KAH9117680.1 hypothetical protein LEN26_012521 [Aphanomyces euteiches]KAH9188481.1 hypothetical protein AeNC1_009543 [Aphanomyces euteiches]